MPLLTPAEYNASYFDGADQPVRHNAGYSRYQRWERHDGTDSTGEYWKDVAFKLLNENSMHNLKVLEIGCAKGFLVEDLNDYGVDCYGLDVSDYALNTAPDAATVRRPDLASKFILGDARTALAQFKRNDFDFVFSLRVLPCFSDTELVSIIDELNRITKRAQFHVIDEFQYQDDRKQGAALYYNSKPLEDWQAMGFKIGTRFISQERANRVLLK